MKPIWQRTFKTQELYEAARLEIIIKLTERALSRDSSKDQEYLRIQLKNLQSQLAKLVDKKKKKR